MLLSFSVSRKFRFIVYRWQPYLKYELWAFYIFQYTTWMPNFLNFDDIYKLGVFMNISQTRTRGTAETKIYKS